MATQKLKRFSEILREDGPRTALNSTISFVRSQTAESWHRRKNQVQHRVQYGGTAPDPDQLIYIDPTNIDWLIVPRYIEPEKYATYVRGGDWDKAYSDKNIDFMGTSEGYDNPENPELIQIDNWTFYQSLRNHFVDGVSWEETEIFEILVKEHCRPGSRWGHSEETVLSRLSEVESLYQDMDRNGYFTQAQLHSRDNVYLNPPSDKKDEILVNIGRDGEIIFCTGRHRFCVARILGIDQIPARVHVRHAQWQKHRHRICENSPTCKHADDKNVNHPDMVDLI